MYIPPTGADHSPYDPRTISHEGDMAVPLNQGGYQYLPQEIYHQHKVGICTAISLTQNASKALGRVYSPDFQYLLQKKFVDGNWDEGSSIFSALKMGLKYGFLPIELFTDINGIPHITEDDRLLPYPQYATKLQLIPDSEVNRLISLCTDKLKGYAQIDVKDSQILARGIIDSSAGILCRYEAGDTWWTANGTITWDMNLLEPQGHLLTPQNSLSGHAITASTFDYSNYMRLTHPNTWGITWDDQGHCHTDWRTYKMTEAWIPYYNTPSAVIQQKITIAQLKLIDLLKQFVALLKSKLLQ